MLVRRRGRRRRQEGLLLLLGLALLGWMLLLPLRLSWGGVGGEQFGDVHGGE